MKNDLSRKLEQLLEERFVRLKDEKGLTFYQGFVTHDSVRYIFLETMGPFANTILPSSYVRRHQSSAFAFIMFTRVFTKIDPVADVATTSMCLCERVAWNIQSERGIRFKAKRSL